MNTNTNNISAVIICKDEEDNISDCLKSVNWVGEIIVVDGGSSDSTVELAKEFTDKVVFNEWDGYTNQRKYALGLVQTDWVLVLDADERCTDELMQEIISKLDSTETKDGYKIPRKSFFLGKWIKHSGWYPGYQIRFFNKNKTTVTERLVHEGYEISGDVGVFKSDILHYTVKSLSDFMSRVNHYSTLAAAEKLNKKIVNKKDLFIRPPMAFIREYFFKKGFLDGVHGLMVAYFNAITNALTYMKIWEMQNKK